MARFMRSVPTERIFRVVKEAPLMENVPGTPNSGQTTALLTLVLAHIVDTLMLHPEIPNMTGLSQRLLEEWYEGELLPDEKVSLSARLAEAATQITRTTYQADRLEAIRRYARTFATEFHTL
jgi:hypothetical protein